MTQPSTWPDGVFVLVPSYKAAGALSRLLPDLLSAAPASSVCIADDGSHDGTDTVCRDCGVLYVSNLVNRGKGAALATGFDYLVREKSASWIITMDADGQHAVADLPVFLNAIGRKPGAGIIIGRRDMRLSKMPVARICSNTLTSAILSMLTGTKIHDSQCGYRAYSARLISAAPCRFSRFEMESEIIMRTLHLGFPVSFARVQTLYFSSPSHISHVADSLRWLRAVVSTFAELRRTAP
ncbi:MAG TPA: glycosyltransferase family 2 protein [Chitinivibrionales bacterium]|jgi:glycosyltransferase involved in cell wall biosynthesis|nr:glycosyltransferase family 2 protein [Chitinivibrionales bacterium]